MKRLTKEHLLQSYLDEQINQQDATSLVKKIDNDNTTLLEELRARKAISNQVRGLAHIFLSDKDQFVNKVLRRVNKPDKYHLLRRSNGAILACAAFACLVVSAWFFLSPLHRAHIAQPNFVYTFNLEQGSVTDQLKTMNIDSFDAELFLRSKAL